MWKHLLQEFGLKGVRMIVAITGASGVIGKAVSEYLEADGHTIIRISRNPEIADVHWNPSTGLIDAKGLNGINAMVHLAGENIGGRRWSKKQKTEIYESRIKGTELIASTLANLNSPPEVFLSGSAIGFYGDCGSTEVDESFPSGEGFLAKVAADWEKSTRIAEGAGIRVAHLRTGIILDPMSGMLQKMLPLFKFGLGGKLGNGSQYWSWISLKDEVRLISWLLSSNISGPVNLSAPNPVTNAEFTRELGKALNRPTVISVPSFGPGIIAGRELAKELIFTSTRALPSIPISHGFEFTYSRLDTTLKEILK